MGVYKAQTTGQRKTTMIRVLDLKVGDTIVEDYTGPDSLQPSVILNTITHISKEWSLDGKTQWHHFWTSCVSVYLGERWDGTADVRMTKNHRLPAYNHRASVKAIPA